jgi:hypothetical protein
VANPKNTKRPAASDYKPANNHVLSTGLRDAPQGQPDQGYKSAGRSSGQDVNLSPLNPGGVTLSDNYGSTPSRGEAKGTRPEVSGGIPRGFVHNEAGSQPNTQDVGSVRPDGSKRVIFGGDIFEGYGDSNGGFTPDPTVVRGGPSSTGPGGAGV